MIRLRECRTDMSLLFTRQNRFRHGAAHYIYYYRCVSGQLDKTETNNRCVVLQEINAIATCVIISLKKHDYDSELLLPSVSEKRLAIHPNN